VTWVLKQESVYYNVTLRCVRATTVAVEKQKVLHILSVFVALGIQHAKRMRCIMLSSVACPSLTYFSTSSHKRKNFRESKLLSTKCVFWFSLQLLSETFLSLRRIRRDVIISVIGLHVKYPFLLSEFNENPRIGRFVTCGRTDGQTYRQTHNEANSRSSQICKRA